MIVDKPPLLGDEVEIQDAPPSYDALEGVLPTAPRDEKAAGPSSPLPITPPTSPGSPGSIQGLGRRSGKRPGNSWFNFGPSSKSVKEVRATLLGLLRDLVKQGDTHGALGVLESCADACKTYDLSLSILLQEKSVEGHTPLYWAIVNRPTLPPRPDDPDLVSAILSHAAPLTDATVDELRLACLHTCDHTLFQKLRRSPAFSPVSARDELILGGNVPQDDVDVEDVDADEGAFVVKFKIPMFQKRMRISESVRLEFIAKGRLWELSFIVAKEWDKRLGHFSRVKSGSWAIKLALLPHSPPTWIDSRLVIEDPGVRGQAASTTSSRSGPPTSLLEAILAPTESPETKKARPPVEVRLKGRDQLTAPSYWTPNIDSAMVVVPIEDNTLANGLQFNGCPYLESDGSLIARLEARLAPPETECVIC
ncbi:hypothetical protein L226DRAFT_540186 [Lentinus tigrinus ALCF2SS1-7]|uniref:Uncharacterized protein n=1 Tax=Lentinus tigrinus ALCF2SS1-6 TaxID=1328759 RepID=A0A5C2S938_9APHY|nr:hypothetical protein L227DRAFT_577540 [Lentinus tigrinus ALCF2SS1-6]RPD69020.1 hypothetical protein L226DRAFT_540186 [Lentinus tigrinus ALCF2SS1-7]